MVLFQFVKRTQDKYTPYKLQAKIFEIVVSIFRRRVIAFIKKKTLYASVSIKYIKRFIMKKIGILALVLVLMTSLVFAADQGSSGGQDIREPGTGIETSDMNESGQGTGQGIQSNIETETTVQQQNTGEETLLQNQIQAQTQSRIISGEYTSENGKQMSVQEQSNNKVQLMVGGASAQTFMELVQEQVQNRTRLTVKLSNGKDSEVKVMPDTASEKALEQLRLKVCLGENACQIELKEVGQGEQTRAAYEVQAQKEAKVFGLFKTRMRVMAQVDAETGDVIRVQKPWWAFLASETEQ